MGGHFDAIRPVPCRRMRSRRHTARMATWRNWAGNQHAEPRSIEHPRDVEEVSLLVKRAAGENRRVKAVGAGHSFTPTAVTDGTPLRRGPRRRPVSSLL